MSEILVVGINHKTATVEVREKLAFSKSQLAQALAFLRTLDEVYEAVIISTCNRTEIYSFGKDGESLLDATLIMLEKIKKIDPHTIRSYLYTYGQEEAVRHLFRVTAGLDSMILGETQILGQVKTAYADAVAADLVDSYFHTLFRLAVTAAKRVQTETEINQNAASISYAAVELAKNIFASLQGRTVMIIGAGKMSELTLRHLYEQGAQNVWVVNRNRGRAKKIAAKYGGRSEDFNNLYRCLVKADIVISSTSAPHYVLRAKDLSRIHAQRQGKPLFLIDIAVPRDIEPQAGELENVFLYDIDDLQAVVAENMDKRKQEALAAEKILDEEIDEYKKWFKTRAAAPLIAALHKKAEKIRTSHLEGTLRKLANLDEREKKHVVNLTRAIVNGILRDPVLRLKESALEANKDFYLNSFCRIFALEDFLDDNSQPSPEKAEDSMPQ
ncbi:MAG: glutamyl-tRNA reductase [Firmicutes bacterium]|nr:glutamyl-tRNA reductase [Bacillota bacterium]